MTSNQRNITVFLAVAGMTAIAAAAYLSLAGVNEENLGVALRLSARIAFLVLLVVFIARPLRQFVATPATATLLHNRRLLGIAFAGIHSAHLGLLVFWANVSPDFDLSLTRNHLGVVTYLVMYAMLVTSFDRPTRALGPKNWKILHKVGLFWLLGSFSQAQLPRSLDDLDEANWWLISIIAIALAIRLTAFFAKRRPGTRTT